MKILKWNVSRLVIREIFSNVFFLFFLSFLAHCTKTQHATLVTYNTHSRRRNVRQNMLSVDNNNNNGHSNAKQARKNCLTTIICTMKIYETKKDEMCTQNVSSLRANGWQLRANAEIGKKNTNRRDYVRQKRDEND